MIDLDHGAGLAERLVLGDLLHRQDRSAGDVVLVENIHGLELGLGHGPLLDAPEDLVEPRQTGRGLGVIGMRLPSGLADHVADLLPYRGLGDEIDVGVGIGLPALALDNASRLAAAGVVAGARHGIAEWDAFAELAVFLQGTVGEALLVAQLDTAEVEHAVLHRSCDALALAGLGALEQRGHDAEREVQAGAAVADLRAGDERQPIMEAGGRSRAAGALRDVLIDLAVFVRSGSKTLDRG